MTLFLNNFHFLRPLWLIALIPAGLLLYVIHIKQDRTNTYKQIIAPHLLSHLIVGEDSVGRLRPLYLLFALWLLTIIALSGPTFKQEPSPFSEDTAAVMIALKVTESMLATDIQPSRLTRSVQKIEDLLAKRPGAKTGLIAFSGTAHLAMPLTTDPDVITTFAGELTPEIMPEKGEDLAKALDLCDHWLEKSGNTGSILLIVDDISPDQRDLLKDFRNRSNTAVHIFAVAGQENAVAGSGPAGIPPLNTANLKTAASVLDASLTLVTADENDVKQLSSKIQHSFSAVQAADEGSRWKDAGYYLVPLIAILGLFWFRQGWIVKWE